jgi:hypothetical protein
VSNLAPGNYTVTISLAGYQTSPPITMSVVSKGTTITETILS